MGEPRALIIAPTRELVVQIANDALDLTKYTGLNVMSFVGGMDFDKQLKQLESRYCDITVATPAGCWTSTSAAKSTGHGRGDGSRRSRPHARHGLHPAGPPDHQADATQERTSDPALFRHLHRRRDELAQQWTTNPAVVEIEPENVASDTVEQHVYAVAGSDKYKLLYNLITQNDWTRVMVFANRKDEVRRIEERLTKDGISAAQMSGDVPQHKRIRTLEGFREGKIRVLVATDVAGRGIHVDGISHVINFTLPEDPDDYVHRIGRTGRAGTSGTSISFAGEDDAFALPHRGADRPQDSVRNATGGTARPGAAFSLTSASWTRCRCRVRQRCGTTRPADDLNQDGAQPKRLEL